MLSFMDVLDIDIIMRFFLKFTYQIFINKERTTMTQDSHVNLLGKFLLSSLSLLVKSIEEEIQPSSDRYLC